MVSNDDVCACCRNGSAEDDDDGEDDNDVAKSLNSNLDRLLLLLLFVYSCSSFGEVFVALGRGRVRRDGNNKYSIIFIILFAFCTPSLDTIQRERKKRKQGDIVRRR